jgi:hypothetical protein
VTANKNPIYRAPRESEEGRLNFVAKINELTFDSIIVEGKKYRRGVLIFADGVVKRRKAGLSGIITAY